MSHNIDEQYSVYRETPRRARKPHRCDACFADTIRPGDHYTAVATIYDGRVASHNRCVRCQAIHMHLRTLCEPGDQWPDEQLDCGEEYESHWERKPPSWVAALAFWLPGDPLPAHEPCTPHRNCEFKAEPTFCWMRQRYGLWPGANGTGTCSYWQRPRSHGTELCS